VDSTEVYDAFRSDVDDQEETFNWPDTDVYRYMDDAQKMFCRLTGGLSDSTSALTVLNYTTASDWVSISPLILKIRDAWNSTTGKPLDIINFENLNKLGLHFDGLPGLTTQIITGMEPHKVRLSRFPNASGTIQLLVDRLPLKKIDDADQALEVDDQHKDGLLLLMKSRAYNKQDAEVLDKKKAMDFETDFRAYCTAAKYERERAMHKTRVVAYGGVPMGGFVHIGSRY
jgi:hypothetical protein